MRVDTVHSGDRDGEKGAYVINMVDEVTQYQQLAAVPRITQHFMVPVLEALVGGNCSAKPWKNGRADCFGGGLVTRSGM